MLLEWLLVAVVLALGVRALGASRQTAFLLAAMGVTTVAAAAAIAGSTAPPAPAPIGRQGEGFATSGACRSCHSAEYSSWHASFHRRMTQVASLTNVAAPSLRSGGRMRIETTGRTVELYGRAHELWARLPDPAVTSAVSGRHYEQAFRAAPIRDVPVQLLTGSHHHQAFWVRGARPGELRSVPVVYSIDEQQLLPRRDAFLNPPDAPEQAVTWNSNCVQCHSVAGAPQHDLASDSFATAAAELGIACEACHGPAAAHVTEMQSPWRRYRARAEGSATSATNPEKLTRERASEVCGRCHSYFFPKDEAGWWQDGFSKSYQPGQDLSRAQLLLSPEALAAAGAPEVGADVESLFYRDGTVRIGGREYNGLSRSPCFERGHGERKLSCLSCHSMHRGDPNDQLDPEKLGNAACTSCHEGMRDNPSVHTHHAAGSPGSLCYNCHMPHTSYALLGAIRSHRVDSPAFDQRTRDRPNACNLCHLEQSEAWASKHTASWFGAGSRFVLDREGTIEVPAGAVFALAGDAAVRAITAAALARSEGSSPSPALRRQLLTELARDDYAAVRFIAERSLKSMPSVTDASPLSTELAQQLLAARDRRPITIAE
ncbi:MAG: hypothetical protein K0R38_5820 [Polyangiaceae bacterium]|nr:hypothetical protein [Polyangiaceae bacterium]